MCKLPAIILRLLAGIACLLACSCFDIREEVWIESDGSGRAHLTYVVPDSATAVAGGNEVLEEKIREAINIRPQLHLDELSVSTGDGRTKIDLKVSTESVLSLRELRKSGDLKSMPSAATDLAGKFAIKAEGWNVDFSRTIRVRQALGLAVLGVRGADKRDRRLTYIIHLPTKAIVENAHHVEDDGKTLIWDMPLGEAMEGPLVTQFTARMPIPRFVWFSAALILVAAIGLLLRIRAVRRKKRRQPAQS